MSARQRQGKACDVGDAGGDAARGAHIDYRDEIGVAADNGGVAVHDCDVVADGYDAVAEGCGVAVHDCDMLADGGDAVAHSILGTANRLPTEDACGDIHTHAADDAAYVYLVECADGTLYCGWTTNVAQRVAAHNTGRGAKYTHGRLPVRLRYAQACADKRAALQREWAIKQLSRSEKLALIAGFEMER